MSDRFFCATAARARGDALAGTAAPARRWLLVEYCDAWATLALQSPGLAGPVARALHEAAVAVGGRVLLVRRPGRRRRRRAQRWAVVDHVAGQVWGTWRDPGDLLEAAAVMRDGPGAGSQTPVLLVCTHGLHDACCAVRGRPVAAVLAARWPEQVWECSHVGGDRFAASLLVVPDGTCYGGLGPASAPAVVESHLEAHVDPTHFRGQSTQPPVVQAATAEVLRRFPPVGPRDVAGATTDQVAADTWDVTLRCGGALPPTLHATVTRTLSAPTQLTCRGRGDAAAYRYEVVDLRTGT
ncbi:MAG TPA: sucrase ferredoxin [Pedococcus sp.]